MPAETILLQDWETPFEMPPFAAIRDEDFVPAFQEAMRLHLAEVEAIANNAQVLRSDLGNVAEAHGNRTHPPCRDGTEQRF